MPDETVRIMCPALACRKVLAVPKSARGKTVRCRNCGSAIRVPSGNTSTPAKPGASSGSQPAGETTKK
ncbi:MAG: hypothetical protein AAFP26_06930 [Planctomycetota bacterium]